MFRTLFANWSSVQLMCCEQTLTNLLILVVLLGCVASRPVIGRPLPPGNSTQMTDRCGGGHGHRDMRQLLCFTRAQAITADTVVAHIPTTTGPIYHQLQAGTQRSACVVQTAAAESMPTRHQSVQDASSAARPRENWCVSRLRTLGAVFVCDCLSSADGPCLEHTNDRPNKHFYTRRSQRPPPISDNSRPRL